MHAPAAVATPPTDVDLDGDLRGARLVGADLAGRDLSGRDLTGADLSRANLAGARLIGTRLDDAVLWQADLTGAECLQASLRRADLREARATGVGFGHADLRHATLLGADLSRATLNAARLDHADLRAANLDGARLVDATLGHADASGATLDHAEVSGCTLPHAVLRDTSWAEARVRGLRDYESADWVGADLRKADLGTAQMLARHAADQNFLWEFRNRSRAARIAYWVWWITSDCGRSFTRWGACTALLAILFAFAYQGVAVDYGDNATWLSPLYFSVVTLTTLGYGDALPVSAAAQALVMLEVTVGYVMLGGLISMFASRWARRS